VTSADDLFDTAVLDIDGTLIDSVYAHVWSWREAFRTIGVSVPCWRLHRAIGMGGDRLVAAVTTQAVEDQMGDEVRSRQGGLYRDLSVHLTPTPGATALLQALRSRNLHVVLASSGSRSDTEQAISLLEAHQLVDAAVSGDDTEATKPDTDPVRRAVQAVDGARAVVIGDAVWDMESAVRAGYAGIGLLTGGIGRDVLMSGGAVDVYDDPVALVEGLDAALKLAAS
jgi:phosphoglycolate phosphatase